MGGKAFGLPHTLQEVVAVRPSLLFDSTLSNSKHQSKTDHRALYPRPERRGFTMLSDKDRKHVSIYQNPHHNKDKTNPIYFKKNTKIY